jgi:hypothetical protein
MHESIYYRLGYALAYQAGASEEAQQSRAKLLYQTRNDLIADLGDDVTESDVIDVAVFTLRDDYLRNDYVHQAFLACFVEHDWTDARQQAFVRGVDDAATTHANDYFKGTK